MVWYAEAVGGTCVGSRGVLECAAHAVYAWCLVAWLVNRLAVNDLNGCSVG